ncbi:MAG: hypothetical protein AAF614_39555 [Chloroflexota bacterium]
MRRLSSLTAVSIFALIFIVLGQTFASAQESNHQVFLPIITKPATAIAGSLQNGSFEEGWTDMPPAPGNLINQQPNGWDYYWIEPGDPLFDSSDTAQGVPESIHKLAEQLPPHERPGGSDALILDGNAVYKIFHFGAPFGAELSQTVADLPPGSVWRLRVPVQVHLHGETDPFGAESSVWVNNEGGWVHGFDMGDRDWYVHEQVVVVPADGQLQIQIRVKSKWPSSKDFFIDDVQLEQVSSLELEREVQSGVRD